MQEWLGPFVQAIMKQDADATGALLEQVNAYQAQPEDVVFTEALACLHSHVAYAYDHLHGTHYLSQDDLERWELKPGADTLLINPIDFALGQGYFYLLDSGVVYRGPLPTPADRPGPGAFIDVHPILSESDSVGRTPVKELGAVAADGERIVALDKSTDLYYSTSGGEAWQLLSPTPGAEWAYTPQYVRLYLTSKALYLLDVAGNQVWRQNAEQQRTSVLASALSWAGTSIGQGVAIDGDDQRVFVLLRTGEVVARLSPQLRQTWSLPTLSKSSHLSPTRTIIDHPFALHFEPVTERLYVALPETRRVVVLDARDGTFLHQFVLPTVADFSQLQGIRVTQNYVYALAGANLYRWSTTPNLAPVALVGQLPEWEEPVLELKPLIKLAPNDPLVVAALRTIPLKMPITGATLPARPSLYPGARRSYRYGVHQGLDFFPGDSGAQIWIGTPVRSVADGNVHFVNLNFQELSAQELQTMLQHSLQQQRTTDEAMQRLHGRQIWIDHNNGLWSRYSHLNGFAEGIEPGAPVKAGQVIGYVGVSGTSDGVSGGRGLVHLHFELWLGDWPRYYLGQWLTIDQSQHLFEAIFSNTPINTAAKGAEPGARATVDLPQSFSLLPQPGHFWPTFVPGASSRTDHYWLAPPFPESHNRQSNPVYPFGGTYGGRYRPHRGLDIINPMGTPVLAMADGEVIHAGPDNSVGLGPYAEFYGNTVVVRLDRTLTVEGAEEPVYLLYGHLNDIMVAVGDRVKTGQPVGTVGATGIALGPHLHLEVRVGLNHYDNTVNPDLWILPQPGTGTLAVRLLNAEGRGWMGVPMQVTRLDGPTAGAKHYFQTYQYDDVVLGDPAWAENALLPNLPAGRYTLTLTLGDETYTRYFVITTGRTTFHAVTTREGIPLEQIIDH